VPTFTATTLAAAAAAPVDAPGAGGGDLEEGGSDSSDAGPSAGAAGVAPAARGAAANAQVQQTVMRAEFADLSKGGARSNALEFSQASRMVRARFVKRVPEACSTCVVLPVASRRG
jgi:hypothetical protein